MENGTVDEEENGEVDEEEDEEEEEQENINENGKQVIHVKSNSDDEIMISDDEEDDEEEEENEVMDTVDETSQTKSETSNSVTGESKKENTEGTKEEIVIDDDEEDEVQDLSTPKSNSLEDLVPKLTDEMVGFPTFLNDVISLGQCIAINKKSRSDIDIDKDSSILDCPSQVVPLIVKRCNKFPAKLKLDKDESSKQMNPPSAPNQNTKNMLTISDFYSSSVGKFLVGIGLSRVKQWYHKDAINKVRKQIRKEGEAEDLMEELKKQQEYLNTCRAANSSYLFPTEKCEHCEFRTEFKLVLNHHLNYPHTARKEFKCNYCSFSTRDSKTIIDHVHMLHEKKCLIEMPSQLYECPICPYESGVKSKAATHIAKCLKYFVPEKLLVNKDDYFPTITPKPITQEDIKIYEATLQALRFAALNPQTKVPQIPGLPPGLQQQMYMVQQQQLNRPGQVRTKPNKSRPNAAAAAGNQFLMNHINLKNVSPQLYQMLSNQPAAQLLQNSAGFSGLPSNALNLLKQQQLITKLANAGVRNSPMNLNSSNKPNIISKQPNNSMNRDGNPKGSFVMCEICDGYIKDLEQLRTHMHWIHKVRYCCIVLFDSI